MKFVRPIVVTLASALLGSAVWAVEPVDHAAHHTEEAAPNKPAPNPTPGNAMGNDASGMDAQMKVMREMHEKMMNAKTPKARQALMAEHMKAMRDGMSMMGSAGEAAKVGIKDNKPADLSACHQTMEKRMEMMEAMMLMMMDRMPSSQTK